MTNEQLSTTTSGSSSVLKNDTVTTSSIDNVNDVTPPPPTEVETAAAAVVVVSDGNDDDDDDDEKDQKQSNGDKNNKTVNEQAVTSLGVDTAAKGQQEPAVVDETTTTTTENDAIETTTPTTDIRIINDLYILPPRQKETKNHHHPEKTMSYSSVVPTNTDTNVATATTTKMGMMVALPPLQCDEQVQSIRLALMDIIPYAHYTNYRLEMELMMSRGNSPTPSDTTPTTSSSSSSPPLEATNGVVLATKTNKNGTTTTKNAEFVVPVSTTTTNTTSSSSSSSGFTGKNAVICIPVQYQATTTTTTTTTTSNKNRITDTKPIVLDEYGDLQIIGQYLSDMEAAAAVQPPPESQSGSKVAASESLLFQPPEIGLRIVLERYNMASLKEHIQRCKYLLSSGQLPTMTTLYETPPPIIPHEQEEQQQHPDDGDDDDDDGTKNHNADTETYLQTAVDENMAATETLTTKSTEENGGTTPTVTTKLLPDLQHVPKTMVVDGTNLQDYFYLIFGEDREMIHADNNNDGDTTTTTDNQTTTSILNQSPTNHRNSNPTTTTTTTTTTNTNKNHHHKKNKKHNKNGHSDKNTSATTGSPTGATTTTTPQLLDNNNNRSNNNTPLNIATSETLPSTMKEFMQQWNELEEVSRCTAAITIQYSGFHPPPLHRKLIGDLAYLIITIPKKATTTTTSTTTVLHITCTTYGFYVNKTVDTTTTATSIAQVAFDPSPAVPESYFSHTLLDCLCSVSLDFYHLWIMALNAAKARNEMSYVQYPPQSNSSNNSNDEKVSTAIAANTGSIYQSIFRTMIRADFDGFRSCASAKQITNETFDAMIVSPTWLVPSINKYTDQQQQGWNHNLCHTYNIQRTEDELLRSCGMVENIRNGTITRDWNEELQVAREMPIATAQERLDRARLIHKVMMEFGEASLHGVMAIAEGQVLPMNPNESIRSQVFLINNIFISRGVDTGPESFKITRGDRAARKASNRDLQCIGIFHRMEGTSRGSNIYTLATVLIDFLGTRFVCQSILPGILIGEKSHTLLYGSVEAGAPLKFDEKLDEALEAQLGHSFMIAPRPIYRSPLLQSDPVDDDGMINTCVAVEAKGILGSDQRRYMLDISRLTPRDANWIPKDIGGTGKYEDAYHDCSMIPQSLDDDEWVTCVLRPELITQFAQTKLKQDSENEKATKLNVNVFIPSIRQLADPIAVKQIEDDETLVRNVASYLWDDVLPRITLAIREGAVTQLPVDGSSLTEFLHRNGVNCRYLGRLAILAKEQEGKDGQERKIMPRCWLDMLEVEMVARAAKHVLDEYLSANGGVAALQPTLTIASFLSALVSEAEETAAQTETRHAKQSVAEGDDDDYAGLTIIDVGGNGDAVPGCIKSRPEIWSDVESEIGRRFRYQTTLFNRGKKQRSLYVPLLRRLCQRIGVKLRSKRYVVGGNCLCGGGSINGRLLATFPVSPLDIVEVMPLMKHVASYREGFQACSVGLATVSLPPLQISLPDARSTLERAHIQASSRAYGLGLQLAQEASTLYQRVTDNTAHPGVIESIDLMATIFLEAGDPVNAALNGEKALALTLQSGGLDSTAAFNAHQLLFQMLFVAHDMERAVKHLRASIYILELMAGPRHTEQYTAYHKLGTVYSHAEYNGKYLAIALKCFREAMNRDSSDRLMDGFMAKNYARTLMGLENFVDALECERKANRTLAMFLGKNHKMTQESDTTIQVLSRLTLERGGIKGSNAVTKNSNGNHHSNNQPKLDDAAAAKIADSIAADLAAEEDRKTTKKKGGGDKKKRGKK